jgi:hypothetical protein
VGWIKTLNARGKFSVITKLDVGLMFLISTCHFQRPVSLRRHSEKAKAVPAQKNGEILEPAEAYN